MASCKDCLFYTKEYDEFRQRYDDVIEIGSEDKVKHHCPIFDAQIPFDVWDGKKDCERFMDKRWV